MHLRLSILNLHSFHTYKCVNKYHNVSMGNTAFAHENHQNREREYHDDTLCCSGNNLTLEEGLFFALL